MKRQSVIWLISALVLIVAGMIIFFVAFGAIGFDFGGLETMKYETNTYEINEDFNKISVDVKTASVTFVHSEDGKCRVECYEQEKVKHTARVEDGELKVSVSDTRKWWDHISVFSFKSPKVTVYLPSTEYLSLSVEANTGKVEVAKEFTFGVLDISVDTSDIILRADVTGNANIEIDTGKVTLEDLSLGSAEISCDTGNITVKKVKASGKLITEADTGKTKLSDVTCNSLDAKGDTGDIVLERVVAEGSFNICVHTGDVIFEKSDAAEIYVKSNTGDVKGSLLSEKIFFARSDTGKVNVPKTMSGGRCEIETDTGNIKITVE